MKLLAIAALVCALAVASVSAASSPNQASWRKFKTDNRKVYNTFEEEAIRFQIFKENIEMIKQHNAQTNKSFVMGLNHLADLYHVEYLQMNGLRRSAKRNEVRQLELSELGIDADWTAPDSVDWSQFPNRVSPVKDQGQCGSCWTFATTGMLEGQERLNSTASVVTELSEQNLIDCDVNGNDHGCLGGDMVDAIQFIYSEGGLDTEAKYPYQSGDGSLDTFDCRYDDQEAFVTTKHITGAMVVKEGDEEDLKKVVAKYGPVAAGIDASHKSFQHYKTGVYYEKECSSTKLDHAVLIVGYGTDQEHGDYWLVKNSWATVWGDKGYFKLARNRNNHCGVATMATVALVEQP